MEGRAWATGQIEVCVPINRECLGHLSSFFFHRRHAIPSGALDATQSGPIIEKKLRSIKKLNEKTEQEISVKRALVVGKANILMGKRRRCDELVVRSDEVSSKRSKRCFVQNPQRKLAGSGNHIRPIFSHQTVSAIPYKDLNNLCVRKTSHLPVLVGKCVFFSFLHYMARPNYRVLAVGDVNVSAKRERA